MPAVAQANVKELTRKLRQKCVQTPAAHGSEQATAPWNVTGVERVRRPPLGPDLSLVAGVDSYGWLRACRITGPDLFGGEYRDRLTWYRGRLRLQWLDGSRAPVEALATFHTSHFDPTDGLLLCPNIRPEPPVPYLLPVPSDPGGYARKP